MAHVAAPCARYTGRLVDDHSHQALVDVRPPCASSPSLPGAVGDELPEQRGEGGLVGNEEPPTVIEAAAPAVNEASAMQPSMAAIDSNPLQCAGVCPDNQAGNDCKTMRLAVSCQSW